MAPSPSGRPRPSASLETVSRDHLRGSRQIALLVAVAYPIFWLFHQVHGEPVIDPLAPRLVVSGYALGFVLASTTSRWIAARASRFMIGLATLLTLHLFWLIAVNALRDEYVIAFLIVLTGITAGHELGFRTHVEVVVFYTAVAAGAAGVALFVESPSLSPVYFFAMVTTACGMSHVGISSQLNDRSALQQSQRRLRTVLSGAPIALWEADRSGNLRFVQGQALEAFDLDLASLVGRPLRSLLGDDPAATKAMDRALHGEAATAIVHVGDRILETWQIPVPGRHGIVSGTVGVATDVTDQHTSWHKLRQVQKMEAVGQLAGGIAHDFNNILTTVLGYNELLLETTPEESPQRLPLMEIKRASERAARLTRQLLAFSRQQSVDLEPVDLNAVVRDTTGMLRRAIGEGMRLIQNPGASIGLALADRTGIEQILLNLAINARDASDGRGDLTISTRGVRVSQNRVIGPFELPAGPYVTLTVEDQGSGMDEATLERVFEPFFTTKAIGEGTGLGLATVYAIVEQCSGAIEVDSEPGRGTAFTIWFRRAAAAPSSGFSRLLEERLAEAG